VVNVEAAFVLKAPQCTPRVVSRRRVEGTFHWV
jgi:hypothetical protein